MKVRSINRFNRSDYPNQSDEFYRLLDNLNLIPDTLNPLLQSNVDIDNNLLAERQTVTLSHGVPVTVRMRKLKQTPFLVRYGYANKNAVRSATITQINADGTIAVTVFFESPAPTNPVPVVLVFEP